MTTNLKTKEEQDTGLVAVVVPEGSKGFLLKDDDAKQFTDIIFSDKELRESGRVLEYGQYEILGLITHKEVGFCAALYVKSIRSLLEVNGLMWDGDQSNLLTGKAVLILKKNT